MLYIKEATIIDVMKIWYKDLFRLFRLLCIVISVYYYAKGFSHFTDGRLISTTKSGKSRLQCKASQHIPQSKMSSPPAYKIQNDVEIQSVPPSSRENSRAPTVQSQTRKKPTHPSSIRVIVSITRKRVS